MLRESPAFSGFSVDDVARARSFYAETLGLGVSEENGMLTLALGSGSILGAPEPGPIGILTPRRVESHLAISGV